MSGCHRPGRRRQTKPGRYCRLSGIDRGRKASVARLQLSQLMTNIFGASVFRSFKHGFDAETVRLLGIALETAIVALRQTWGMADPPRDEIVRIIIELAQAGERDPDLCEAVLKALGAAGGTYPWGRNYALAAAAPLPSWKLLQPRFGGADLSSNGDLGYRPKKPRESGPPAAGFKFAASQEGQTMRSRYPILGEKGQSCRSAFRPKNNRISVN
jgi:hypothetical protein